jgi:WD40 repeat protein
MVQRDSDLNLLQVMEGHQLGVISVAPSPIEASSEFSDSQSIPITFAVAVVATSSLDSQIRIWDLENKQLKKTIDAGPGE